MNTLHRCSQQTKTPMPLPALCALRRKPKPADPCTGTDRGCEPEARTQQQCDAETEAAARKRAQTEADCKAMLARTQQEIQQRRAAFDRRASELLDGYHSTEFLPEERAK